MEALIHSFLHIIWYVVVPDLPARNLSSQKRLHSGSRVAVRSSSAVCCLQWLSNLLAVFKLEYLSTQNSYYYDMFFWITIGIETGRLRFERNLGCMSNIIAGCILWEQIREEWTEAKKLRPKVKQVREPVLRYGK